MNGGDPNSWVDVGFRAILLGWSGADMVQDVARRLVCRIARAPTSGEFLPEGPLPTREPISMIYLDDCNFIGKVVVGDVRESNEHKRFVAACCQAGLECCCHAVAGR